MAFSFTFKPLHQETHLQLSSFVHCKYSSTLNTFKFHNSSNIIHTYFQPTEHSTFKQRFSPFLEVKTHAAHLEAKLLSDTHEEISRNTTNHKAIDENFSGFSSFSLKNGRVGETSSRNGSFHAVVDQKDNMRRVILKDRHARTRINPKGRSKMDSRFSSVKCKDEKFVKNNAEKSKGSEKIGDKIARKSQKDNVNEQEVEKVGKGSKKSKVDHPGAMLRLGLDMCSKRGDVMGAIRLYDLARKEGIKMGQYHYAVLLYLCSSAATGVVQPAKSGSGNRSLNHIASPKEISNVASEYLSEFEQTGKRGFGTNESDVQYPDKSLELKASDKEDLDINGFQSDAKDSLNGSLETNPKSLDELVQLMKSNAEYSRIRDARGEQVGGKIQISEEIKKYALKRGFEIYDHMCLDKVPMNEATFTSVARMAMSLGDGDMAFDIVKQMKKLGIDPRLRSYGPALSVFCNNGDVEKAFIIEQHMLEHGVHPEEPELEALLRLSVEVGRSDKIYYLLHKLRTSVRQVSPSSANLIEKWFRSKSASRVGKRKWDQRLVIEAMQNGGGGWHGQGWLGTGKWAVSHTSVGSDGLCKSCGAKLVTIDLDPAETENFARSVASIAAQREKHSSFQKFQKWLDYYGPFEAVVDGANVGLYSQRKFKPSKVNAVMNGIRQMLPSKKLPLIVLHNRRITGDKMNEPVNRAIIDKWRNADALYATPTGSNDDWYWLYAAIKFKCLIVTNDEMRDHLFQLLGNDFFPRWKERHQVRFTFSETGPMFHMPPPCSVVIQESEKGHWHIPIISDFEAHGERTWLCITRPRSLIIGMDSSNIDEELDLQNGEEKHTKSGVWMKARDKLASRGHCNPNDGSKQAPQEIYRSLRSILSSSLLSDHRSILPELEASEKLGNCIIDFQI